MPPTPEEERRHRWRHWTDQSLGEAAGWFVGYCPLHDPQRLELGSAEFNFNNGTFRCKNVPRCHHKAGMTIANLVNQMIELDMRPAPNNG